MKTIYLSIIFILFQLSIQGQNEFHVFPVGDLNNPGASNGNGSLQSPWDLQTALSQTSKVVNGGDFIWVHNGIYNGHYISTLNSSISNKFITVAAFKDDNVILNGNVKSLKNNVLQVKGKQVIFKDFDVTCLGDFSRSETDSNFKRINGIDHASGEDCKFINIKIHDLPGLAFGSWKNTGGTIIKECIIYNNGYISKDDKGRGEGIYVQNNSNSDRIIENNIIFNNYYKGIEVWSANRNAKDEYVKNVILRNNIIFNNGSPSGVFKDNLIVATNDKNGKNIAKNITVLNNIFYHNTDILKNQINGDAASLTIGFSSNAPVENIKVHNNIIIGRNNALRILHAKTLSYRNNISYAGYVHFFNSVLSHINDKNWDFKSNTFYTKNSRVFRISKHKDYTFADWKSTFNIDLNSQANRLRAFNLPNTLNISKVEDNTFRVVLFNKVGDDVEVDLSKYNIPLNSSYKIYDVENSDIVLKKGIVNGDRKVLFPMGVKAFKKPLHNNKAQKTLSNFGVYLIKFEDAKKEKRKSTFRRFLERLF